MGQLLSNPVVSQFIGLVVGLFTSFFSWWVLFRWMAPRITLSNYNAKSKTSTPAHAPEQRLMITSQAGIIASSSRTVADALSSILKCGCMCASKGSMKITRGCWKQLKFLLLQMGKRSIRCRSCIQPERPICAFV